MLEYACQRIYRDARITSIYEGTTQLQTVAAIRYVTNGFYAQVMEEMMVETSAANQYSAQVERIKGMMEKFISATAAVREKENQELLDFSARHLYEMAADIIMSHLMLQHAAKAPELFEHTMNNYLNMAEAEVAKHSVLVNRFIG